MLLEKKDFFCVTYLCIMGGAVSAGQNNGELVDNLKAASYITTPEVERVFRAVDRAEYFPEGTKDHAYKDLAWKSGNIHLSAPCIYSQVLESLELKEGLSFLNLGSGTGYLSTMVGLMIGSNGINHGVELFEDVVEFAEKKLVIFKSNPAYQGPNFGEPVFIVGNCLSLNTHYRQYDRVYCGAACPPEYEEYMKSLVKVGGILVMPFNDKLCRMRHIGQSEWDIEGVLPVSFAPLIDCKDKNRHLLKYIEIPTHPRYLQDLCRLVIRRTLGTQGVKKLTDLPLPPALVMYLNYFHELRQE